MRETAFHRKSYFGTITEVAKRNLSFIKGPIVLLLPGMMAPGACGNTF